MATQIGEIKVIIGKVELITPDGPQSLKVGDKVFADQVITTGATGAVEIEFVDGSVMALPQNSQAVLDSETFDPLQASKEQDIAALQEAIADGTDPTNEAEPTAANAGTQPTGNEGSSNIQVLHEQPIVTPESGFETSFSSVGPVGEDIEEGLFLPAAEALDTNDAPNIIVGESKDDSSEFTIVNNDEVSSAGYHNSYGYYVKTLDAEGNVISESPTIGVIVEDDVHFRHGGFTDAKTVTGYDMEQIGYFIIPNGDGKNKFLSDSTDVTFKYVNNSGNEVATTEEGQWQAFSGETPIRGSGSHVLFDDAALNKDGQDHLVDNNLAGNQNWEDLQIPNGDGDYNDVNTNVDWTKVTVSGDVVNSVDFGNDTPGTIDFSLSEDIVMNGILTSNGKAIEFSARDTDNDNHNDQIVGSTDDGEVLTIDGLLEGEYAVSVLGPIDDNNGDSSVALQANVSATDGGGDVANTILNINLNIDTNQILDSLLPPIQDV